MKANEAISPLDLIVLKVKKKKKKSQSEGDCGLGFKNWAAMKNEMLIAKE